MYEMSMPVQVLREFFLVTTRNYCINFIRQGNLFLHKLVKDHKKDGKVAKTLPSSKKNGTFQIFTALLERARLGMV